MNKQALLPTENSVLRCGLLLGILLLAHAPSTAHGQTLVFGELVRVDSQTVGRVVSTRDGQLVVVRGRGDATEPRPDTVRVSRDSVFIERSVGGGPKTMLGAVIGGVAFGALGYVIGPKLGWGTASTSNLFDPHTAEEVGQAMGALIFGSVGAGLGALIGSRLPDQWKQVAPSFALSDGRIGLGVMLSLGGGR